jgi:hypothetical protein
MSADSPILRGDSMVSTAPPQVRKLVERFERTARLATIEPHEHAALQRYIDTTDRLIDPLVYPLYGSTYEEIRIVEEATR